MELYDKDASLSTKSQAVINHINGRTLAYVKSVTHKRNELKAENKRQSSKANHCIPPAWTKKKWRTMRRALFTLDVESTSGIPYSFTFRLNRPGFPGECFICELRLPDHRFRWKH
ncbi:hypothetical protein OSL78_02610, partial [Escherichia coli]|nr:hypothetical protein [Escherichia coli]